MAESQSIKSLDRTSVLRICSGQVILDLATAVKELIENSMDAGATSIDIRLKEHGSEIIEVSDNGGGVLPKDRENMMKQYYTSKLSTFDDLVSLGTFGFRGEALSSLCAIASVSVVTRVEGEECGAKLEYDSKGTLIKETMVARSVGTTVAVKDLFHSLPVRYKEFKKNLKRDYSRLVSLVQAYSLISTHVRMVCSNQSGTGRSMVVATPPAGKKTIRDNVNSIFGRKVSDSLIDVEGEDKALNIKIVGLVSSVKAGGGKSGTDRRFFYVNGRPVDFPKASMQLNEIFRTYSSPAVSASSRPVGIINIILPLDSYDVNVTPDKRKVFLHNEGEVLRVLQDTLIKAWEPSRSTYRVRNIVKTVVEKPMGSYFESLSCKKMGDGNGAEAACDANGETHAGTPYSKPSQGDSVVGVMAIDDVIVGNVATDKDKGILDDGPGNNESDIEADDGADDKEVNGDEPENKADISPVETKVNVTEKECTHDSNGHEASISRKSKTFCVAPKTVAGEKSQFVVSQDESSEKANGNLRALPGSQTPTLTAKINGRAHLPSLESFALGAKDSSVGPTPNAIASVSTRKREITDIVELESFRNVARAIEETVEFPGLDDESRNLHAPEIGPTELDRVVLSSEQPIGDNLEPISDQLTEFEPQENKSEPVSLQVEEYDDGRSERISPAESHGHLDKDTSPVSNLPSSDDRYIIHVSMEDIRKKTLDAARKVKAKLQPLEKTTEKFIFASMMNVDTTVPHNGAGLEDATKDPDALDAAEVELERVFKKHLFKEMEVVGQFNLGFIIGKLGNDLYIIDQHASDEKYNFERLQKTASLKKQPMIQPMKLHLSPAEEQIVTDHMEVFQKNGFDFVSGDDGSLQMTAVPHCLGVTFGESDLIEMIGKIEQGERSLWHLEAANPENRSYALHPSKFRSLLASKACRSSIMIGKALDKLQMRRILDNLSTLVSPWNCPHGRPTMRHLARLPHFPNQ